MMSSMYELKEPSKAVAWAKIWAVRSDGIWIVFVAVCANANAGAMNASDISDEIVINVFFMRTREGTPHCIPSPVGRAAKTDA